MTSSSLSLRAFFTINPLIIFLFPSLLASASTTSSSERSSIGIGRINCPEDTPLITQLQDQLQTLAQDYENSIALWGMEKETILSALYASNSKLFAVKKAIQAPLMAESPHSNPPAINNNASSSPSSSATSSTVEAASRIVAGIVSKRPKSILKNRGIFDISSASTDTLKIDDDESNGEEAAESSSSTTPSSIVKKRVQWTSVVISAHEEKERRKRIKTSFISLSSTLMMDDEVVAEGEINESKSIGDFSFTGSSSSSSSSGEEGVVEEEDDPTDEELDTFSAMVRENLKSPRIQNGIGANSDIKLMIQVTPASPTSNVDDDEDCVILSAKSFDTLLEEEQGLMKVAALKSSGSSISSIERRHTTPPCDAISDSKTNINEATEETNVVAVGSSGSSSTNINADPPLPTVILRNFTVPSLLRKKKSNVAPPNPNLIEEIMNLKSIISVDPPIGATPTPLSSPEEEEASIKHTKHDSTATLDESPSASLGASSSSNEGNGEISAAVVASGNENPAMKKSASISNLKKRLSSMKLKSTPYTSPLTPTAEATSSSARAKRKWFSKK